MSAMALASVGLAYTLAVISLGGGFYETSVVDPAWPARPEIISPRRGGLDRKWFWIPAHTAFELALLASLVLAWSEPAVRCWLLIALAAHVAMRIWSAVDFIPKALRFEAAEPGTVVEASARRWTRRSRLRLPLDVVTCGALFAAGLTAARLI
jgi:hypothetical protein